MEYIWYIYKNMYKNYYIYFIKYSYNYAIWFTDPIAEEEHMAQFLR